MTKIEKEELRKEIIFVTLCLFKYLYLANSAIDYDLYYRRIDEIETNNYDSLFTINVNQL